MYTTLGIVVSIGIFYKCTRLIPSTAHNQINFLKSRNCSLFYKKKREYTDSLSACPFLSIFATATTRNICVLMCYSILNSLSKLSEICFSFLPPRKRKSRINTLFFYFFVLSTDIAVLIVLFLRSRIFSS